MRGGVLKAFFVLILISDHLIRSDQHLMFVRFVCGSVLNKYTLTQLCHRWKKEKHITINCFRIQRNTCLFIMPIKNKRTRGYATWNKEKESRSIFFAVVGTGSYPPPPPPSYLYNVDGIVARPLPITHREERHCVDWREGGGWLEPNPTTAKMGIFLFCSTLYIGVASSLGQRSSNAILSFLF
jgi:hypothetical protein